MSDDAYIHAMTATQVGGYMPETQHNASLLLPCRSSRLLSFLVLKPVIIIRTWIYEPFVPTFANQLAVGTRTLNPNFKQCIIHNIIYYIISYNKRTQNAVAVDASLQMFVFSARFLDFSTQFLIFDFQLFHSREQITGLFRISRWWKPTSGQLTGWDGFAVVWICRTFAVVGQLLTNWWKNVCRHYLCTVRCKPTSAEKYPILYHRLYIGRTCARVYLTHS